MKVRVNEEVTELDGQTVGDLMRQLGLPDRGVAVAVSMEIIPHESWDTYVLNEGDDVMIIRAVSGG